MANLELVFSNYLNTLKQLYTISTCHQHVSGVLDLGFLKKLSSEGGGKKWPSNLALSEDEDFFGWVEL